MSGIFRWAYVHVFCAHAPTEQKHLIPIPHFTVPRNVIHFSFIFRRVFRAHHIFKKQISTPARFLLPKRLPYPVSLQRLTVNPGLILTRFPNLYRTELSAVLFSPIQLTLGFIPILTQLQANHSQKNRCCDRCKY